MNQTWQGSDAPEPVFPRPGLAGRWRMLRRGAALSGLLALGLAVHSLLRLVEWPVSGQARPLSPYITQGVCRLSFRLLGIRYSVRGTPLNGPGAVVSNHASWLDIFALNAAKRVYFVSKDEVAGWPGIGLLARITGTLFIRRDRRDANAQISQFRSRLALGHRLLFFPEGTSTDSRVVLPFKSTLFAAFFAPDLVETLTIQPVTLRYTAPSGEDERFYGWWGDMEFGPHLAHVLAARRQGAVEVICHEPLNVRDFPDRKALAAHCEAVVRGGFGRANQSGIRASGPE